ncbi:galactose-1-epimerase [Aristophania vespae]|uniref:Aldose 1-epimerase n=1 Tax=Aristophania vespae TaxID=2697033 RepID=A0A6P1NM62_9PROT|nr:aldose epimerase family protein [Aristophania vespae]QHI95941.1 galactose-1-epimerase [Aristophania vespae]
MKNILTKNRFLMSASALTMAFSVSAQAMPKAKVENWGKLADGQTVKSISLTNDRSTTVRIITYGGIIQSVETPDKKGKIANIALGFDSIDGYVKNNKGAFFGAVLGRVANRIANGTFTLEGKTYHTSVNEGQNTLHGGVESFSRKFWTIDDVGQDKNGAHVRLKLISPDGDQGFPGTVTASVTYTLSNDNSLKARFQAQTDAPTIVNLTTHNYWNLLGEGSGTIEPEILQIFADKFVETDAASLPTGKLVPVAGTALDFNKPHKISDHLRSKESQMIWPRGYDKCWVIKGEAVTGKLRPAAKLTDPRSGRVLEVYTDQPGMQFYTSNSLDGRYVGPSGQAYRQGDAVAFEPEHFPDSANHSNFPTIELKPGQSYDHVTIFKFSHN